MGRWQPDARERLERAAVALFVEQGFAATTVPQITARAGLTTRTFFRYFADKREVLFAGQEIPELVARLMAEAPAGLDPVTVLVEGLQRVADERFEGRREEIRVRRDVIAADDSLRERDLHKRAAVAAAVRQGFLDRQVEPVVASLLADTCVTVLYVALDQWLARDDDVRLADLVTEAWGSLRSVLGPTAER